MPNTPRFDKNTRLLHRFYEPLVLLQILTPSTQVHGRPPSEPRHGLCDFLDQLAWTCDFHTGGKTVTAIAIEENPQSLTYWLASPGSARADVEHHICAILNDLKLVYNVDRDQMSHVEEGIRSKCIAFSHRKIKNYRRLLSEHLEIFDKGQTNSSEGRSQSLMSSEFSLKTCLILTFLSTGH